MTALPLQGLTHLTQLVNLNLSNNFLSRLTGLAHLPCLHTLTLARNKLRTAEDVKELEACKTVACLGRILHPFRFQELNKFYCRPVLQLVGRA